MTKPWLALRALLISFSLILAFGAVVVGPLSAHAADNTTADPSSIQTFASNFWQWRARYQPFSTDDIPRIERPSGPRDWSANSIAKQKTMLEDFEKQWKQIDPKSWTVAQQIDYRLMGSALARVRWELELNPRWRRDPTFYVDQTVTALLEALVQPPPFDEERSRIIVERMQAIPQIIADGRANLHAVRPFAALAIKNLQEIRPQLQRVESQVAPMLHSAPSADAMLGAELAAATENAVAALESYRTWLEKQLSTLPEDAAVGRANYEFFVHQVALLPYTPEQLLEISRQEWARSVAFEQYEQHRNEGLPDLKVAASLDAEVKRAGVYELEIRKFLEEKGILTVPPAARHYVLRPMPDYLAALGDFGELDDFTNPSRLNDDGIRWVSPPTGQLGYFWLATAKDPRPDMVHEGIPGHFFQMTLSWTHPDPIRRHYYDSGANEGIGFYSEEMMMQAGLFDNSPRSREIIYNFMRLRALRVEVDVKLALGIFTMEQAANYLSEFVPMDKKAAAGEAALFATTPGQAISYQIGKSQILQFLAEARVARGDQFKLRAFHDFLWMNGNVPIALQSWEYLGDDRDLQIISRYNDNVK